VADDAEPMNFGDPGDQLMDWTPPPTVLALSTESDFVHGMDDTFIGNGKQQASTPGVSTKDVTSEHDTLGSSRFTLLLSASTILMYHFIVTPLDGEVIEKTETGDHNPEEYTATTAGSKKGEILSTLQSSLDTSLNVTVADIPSLLFDTSHSPLHSSYALGATDMELPPIGTSNPEVRSNLFASTSNVGSTSTSLQPFSLSLPTTSYLRKHARSDSSSKSGFTDPGRPKNNPWKKMKV
jgi:hypothetical protein